MNDYGYITYYGNEAFVLPSALKAGIVPAVHAEGQYAEISWIYPGGSIVPAQTGVIINGASGTYVCSLVSDDTAAPADNLLKGSTVETETTGTDCLFYKLAADDSQTVGFYWGADNGAAFMNQAYKAYLALPQAQASEINGFLIDTDGGTTGVTDIQAKNIKVDVYTLGGVLIRQQVEAVHALDGLQKGIYIVNGKKIIK